MRDSASQCNLLISPRLSSFGSKWAWHPQVFIEFFSFSSIHTGTVFHLLDTYLLHHNSYVAMEKSDTE